MKRVRSSGQQVIDATQPRILQLQIARLRQTPDANIIEYIKTNLEQITVMAKIDNDECFRFLFSVVEGGTNPACLVPYKIINRRMASDMSMIHAVYSPSKHTVAAKKKQLALQDLQAADLGLIQCYGPDIQIVVDPIKATGKEKITYEMVQDFWSQVSELPTARTVGAIRLMLSAEMQ